MWITVQETGTGGMTEQASHPSPLYTTEFSGEGLAGEAEGK